MGNLDFYRLMSHSDILREPIIGIYNDYISGNRKSMPKGTWKEEGNVILIYRYVLEIKMRLNKEQIPKITKEDIRNHKLWGSLNRYKSIKRIIHLVYPNQYIEFDFHRVTKDYWADKNKIKERLEIKLKEHGFSINEIPQVVGCETLIVWDFLIH